MVLIFKKEESMKLLMALFFGLSVLAQIPTGNYKLEKIVCSDGKVLKLGGKFMIYDVSLEIFESEMKMTAIAKNAKFAPFKLNCTQVNKGSYTITSETNYEGSLPLFSVKCNAKAWESILNKQHFGVEEQGVFDYEVDGNKLVLFNPATATPYSCKDTNSYPVYHYIKK